MLQRHISLDLRTVQSIAALPSDPSDDANEATEQLIDSFRFALADVLLLMCSPCDPTGNDSPDCVPSWDRTLQKVLCNVVTNPLALALRSIV